MIRIENLGKTYGKIPVLRGLTLEIPGGKVSGLAGPNACGKTTLIKSILGLVIPDSGRVTVQGEPVSAEHSRELIGYMPQQADFPGQLSAQELFSLLAAVRSAKPVRRAELIERFGLEAHLKKPLGSLSAGTRQKVSAVAALMFRPPVLILDEPTAGFDPVSCVHFKELIAESAAQGTTVLMVSHIMPELEQLIDELIFMLDGSVLFHGSLDQLSVRTESRGLEAGIVRLLSRGASHERSAGNQ